jgi:hypothetical protein
MDNAGGHGKQDIIDEYIKDLKQKFNVRVVWQEPRSPETNILDLGVWMSLQSAVEKMHRKNRSDVNALARTVEATWESFDSAVFSNVYRRWKKILSLILADNGDNTLVDSHRGELLVPAVVAVVTIAADEAEVPEETGDVEDEDIDEEDAAEDDNIELGWPEQDDDPPAAIEVDGDDAPGDDNEE